MKTSWRDIISAVSKMNGIEYTVTVTARHYMISACDKTFKCTFKNKWRAMLNMKLYAIVFDIIYGDDFGIYYTIEKTK